MEFTWILVIWASCLTTWRTRGPLKPSIALESNRMLLLFRKWALKPPHIFCAEQCYQEIQRNSLRRHHGLLLDESLEVAQAVLNCCSRCAEYLVACFTSFIVSVGSKDNAWQKWVYHRVTTHWFAWPFEIRSVTLFCRVGPVWCELQKPLCWWREWFFWFILCPWAHKQRVTEVHLTWPTLICLCLLSWGT